MDDRQEVGPKRERVADAEAGGEELNGCAEQRRILGGDQPAIGVKSGGGSTAGSVKCEDAGSVESEWDRQGTRARRVADHDHGIAVERLRRDEVDLSRRYINE